MGLLGIQLWKLHLPWQDCQLWLQWVGGVAVEMAGGPAVPLLPGRHDCGCFDNSTVLPDECSTLEELASFWGD